jgi:S1-C subfamily serine protease
MKRLSGFFLTLAIACWCWSGATGQGVSVVSVSVNKVKPAVVTVHYPAITDQHNDERAPPTKTIGMIVDPRGYVIAPALSSRAATKIVLGDGCKLSGKTVFINPAQGYALYKVEAAKLLPHVNLADDGEVAVGDTVIALGRLSSSPDAVVSVALVGAKNRQLPRGGTFLELDSALSPGLPSGLIIDLRGNLIGSLPKRGGVGLVIPRNQVKEIMANCPNPPKEK